MEKVTLRIDGMSCGHCVSAVAKALGQVEGVRVENVAVGEATVAYEPGTTNEAVIAEAIADEGYQVVATER